MPPGMRASPSLSWSGFKDGTLSKPSDTRPAIQGSSTFDCQVHDQPNVCKAAYLAAAPTPSRARSIDAKMVAARGWLPAEEIDASPQDVLQSEWREQQHHVPTTQPSRRTRSPQKPTQNVGGNGGSMSGNGSARDQVPMATTLSMPTSPKVEARVVAMGQSQVSTSTTNCGHGINITTHPSDASPRGKLKSNVRSQVVTSAGSSFGYTSNCDLERKPMSPSRVDTACRRQSSGTGLEYETGRHSSGTTSHNHTERCKRYVDNNNSKDTDGKANRQANKNCGSFLKSTHAELSMPSERNSTEPSDSGGSYRDQANDLKEMAPEGVLRELNELRELCAAKVSSAGTVAARDAEIKEQLARERAALQAREWEAEVRAAEGAARRREAEARSAEDDQRQMQAELMVRERDLANREQRLGEREASIHAGFQKREQQLFDREQNLLSREQRVAEREADVTDRWREFTERQEKWRLQRIAESEEFECRSADLDQTAAKLKEELDCRNAQLDQKSFNLKGEEDRLKERWRQLDEREMRWGEACKEANVFKHVHPMHRFSPRAGKENQELQKQLEEQQCRMQEIKRKPESWGSDSGSDTFSRRASLESETN